MAGTTNDLNAPQESIKEYWCLVTLAFANKRELVNKQINISFEKENVQDLILRIELPEEAVYQNMILLKVKNFGEVRDRLKNITYVQSVQLINLPQANRILGIKA